MTEVFLPLIASYGLGILFVVVLLACLALPLPASMMAMASGSFAASGDLDLMSSLLVAYIAFIVGDQIAYQLARWGGPALLARLARGPARARMIARAEAFLIKRGVAAVFLSRTIVSPIGPYVSYLCGIAGLNRLSFFAASATGAAVWVAVYIHLGYYFAPYLAELAALLNDGLMVIVSATIAIGAGVWLTRSWKRYKNEIRE